MRNAFGIVALGLAVSFSADAIDAQSADDVWWDDYDETYFHTAVNDYYDVPVGAGPPPSYLYPDELPVVYLLAREARVSPEVVMALREQGWTWLEITHHLGVDPYLYVARLPRRSDYWGWNYGRNYHYLTDRLIIDYVNLVFWADYYRRPVTHVIVLRQRVPHWYYFVRYYAPPRVVYVRNPVRWASVPPRRGDSGRSQPVRRAEPRHATTGPVSRTATRPTTRATPNAPVRSRDTATRTPDRNAIPSRGTQATRPSTRQATTPITRPTPRATRPTRPAQGNRPAALPSRPVHAAPSTQRSRPAAQPSRSARTSRPTRSPAAAQASRPAAQRSSSSSRPAASSARSPSSSRSGTTTRRPARPRPGG